MGVYNFGEIVILITICLKVVELSAL